MPVVANDSSRNADDIRADARHCLLVLATGAERRRRDDRGQERGIGDAHDAHIGMRCMTPVLYG